MPKLKIYNFSQKELRGDFYPMFLKMMDKGLETEAMLFMLATWNFARFRYAIRTFNLSNFQRTLKNLEPVFKKIQKEKFRTINFDEHSQDIKNIFNSLSKIKGIEKTGAPKLMHLKNPEVFVMWDGYIRNYYGFKKGDVKDYVEFLKLMQKKYSKIKPITGRTTAKLIDENNYITITMSALKTTN